MKHHVFGVLSNIRSSGPPLNVLLAVQVALQVYAVFGFKYTKSTSFKEGRFPKLCPNTAKQGLRQSTWTPKVCKTMTQQVGKEPSDESRVLRGLGKCWTNPGHPTGSFWSLGELEAALPCCKTSETTRRARCTYMIECFACPF